MPEPRDVERVTRKHLRLFLCDGLVNRKTLYIKALGVAADIIEMAAQAKFLYINTRDELHRIDCTKIVYMEGNGNYTTIVLINKIKVSVCKNLAEMQRLISNSLQELACSFIRIGKRFIVNVNYIHHINVPRQSLVVTDGVHFAFQLGISSAALKQLKVLMVENARMIQPNNFEHLLNQ